MEEQIIYSFSKNNFETFKLELARKEKAIPSQSQICYYFLDLLTKRTRSLTGFRLVQRILNNRLL